MSQSRSLKVSIKMTGSPSPSSPANSVKGNEKEQPADAKGPSAPSGANPAQGVDMLQRAGARERANAHGLPLDPHAGFHPGAQAATSRVGLGLGGAVGAAPQAAAGDSPK